MMLGSCFDDATVEDDGILLDFLDSTIP